MRVISLLAIGCGLASARSVKHHKQHHRCESHDTQPTDVSPPINPNPPPVATPIDAPLPISTPGEEAPPPVVAPSVPGTEGRQPFPDTPKAPGTFAKPDVPLLVGIPPDLGEIPDADMYGVRDVDLPFGRLFHGNLNFFKTTNDPAGEYDYSRDTSAWGSQYDDANQTACGIPYNAYYISSVAIHPYFLKYAGLDRYCMQDVCISFWSEDGHTDMMLKVTDVCTPDSADGVPCMDPMDIKVERTKAKIMYGTGNPPEGDQFPEKVWWFFTKCWADGLAQPAYIGNDNWFTEPYLGNNLNWSQQTGFDQFSKNQENYPALGWETYPNGFYNTTRVAYPINDWDPENPPAWTPIAGGKSLSSP